MSVRGAEIRERSLETLGRRSFDLLVIGGGIVGARVALEASCAGLRVALVDAGDFGGATSSASGKLVHNGLRYLRTRRFRLVRAALRERSLLATHRPIALDAVRTLPAEVRPRRLHPCLDPLPGASPPDERALRSALDAVLALNAINPDALIARTNLDRMLRKRRSSTISAKRRATGVPGTSAGHAPDTSRTATKQHASRRPVPWQFTFEGLTPRNNMGCL